MRLQETIAFYLLIGAGVSLATLMASERRGRLERVFLGLTAALFWPLYVPILLSWPPAKSPDSPTQPVEPHDAMAAAIAQVNTELAGALSSLDGWAENVLDSQQDRLSELPAALAAQAARIRAMDGLLSAAESAELPLADSTTSAAGERGDRWRQSEEARAQNVARLAAVRRQSHAELMATLAGIRELVSMVHLAKFTGAPAARAEELVAQLAAAVEGISAVAADRSLDSPSSDDARRGLRSGPNDENFPIHSDIPRSSRSWVSSDAPAM